MRLMYVLALALTPAFATAATNPQDLPPIYGVSISVDSRYHASWQTTRGPGFPIDCADSLSHFEFIESASGSYITPGTYRVADFANRTYTTCSSSTFTELSSSSSTTDTSFSISIQSRCGIDAGAFLEFTPASQLSIEGRGFIVFRNDDWIRLFQPGETMVTPAGVPIGTQTLTSNIAIAVDERGPDGLYPSFRMSTWETNLDANGNFTSFRSGRVVGTFSPGIYELQASWSINTTFGENEDRFEQKFLNSIGWNYEVLPGPPPMAGELEGIGDFDGDSLFTLNDLYAWLANPNDANSDGTTDPTPFGTDAGFLAAAILSANPDIANCNRNAFPDAYEIDQGALADANADGIPDICVGCNPADIAAAGDCTAFPDGAVALSDFSCYLADWAAGRARADITADGSCVIGTGGDGVTLSDFSCYLSLWAAGCP